MLFRLLQANLLNGKKSGSLFSSMLASQPNYWRKGHVAMFRIICTRVLETKQLTLCWSHASVRVLKDATNIESRVNSSSRLPNLRAKMS